jgi:hypothetical protein
MGIECKKVGRKESKRHTKLLGAKDILITVIAVMVLQYAFVKVFTLYTFNVCNLAYVCILPKSYLNFKIHEHFRAFLSFLILMNFHKSTHVRKEPQYSPTAKMNKLRPDSVAHTCITSIWEAGAEESQI